MPGLTRPRILLLALAALVASPVWAADGSVATTSSTPPSYILVRSFQVSCAMTILDRECRRLRFIDC